MKKSLTIVMSLFLCMNGMAQEKQFNAALSAGRAQNQFYVVKDPKGKALKLSKLTEYAEQQGYLVGSMKPYIGKKDAVESFEFLPKDEFISYIYSNLREDSRDLSDLPHKGTVFCYLPDDQTKVYFWQCDNALWSGQVVNGLINGSGSGFMQVKNNAVVYFKGFFNNGIPEGDITFKWYPISDMGKFASKLVTETSTKVGKQSDGLASFSDLNRYGFINGQGLAVLPPVYPAIITDFADGRATVEKFDDGKLTKKEVIIDKTGKVVDYSAKQKEIFAQQAREKAARELQAKIDAEKQRKADSLAEIKRIEEQKVAEQNRILAEKQKAEAAKATIAAKKNSVGKRIKWREKITFDTSGGGLGGLLTKAVGLGSTSYSVEYTAIVESVIGEENVKAIITNAKIIDPSWASVNYFKYKSYAREEASKAIGQTRVKEFSEFDMAK